MEVEWWIDGTNPNPNPELEQWCCDFLSFIEAVYTIIQPIFYHLYRSYFG